MGWLLAGADVWHLRFRCAEGLVHVGRYAFQDETTFSVWCYPLWIKLESPNQRGFVQAQLDAGITCLICLEVL